MPNACSARPALPLLSVTVPNDLDYRQHAGLIHESDRVCDMAYARLNLQFGFRFRD